MDTFNYQLIDEHGYRVLLENLSFKCKIGQKRALSADFDGVSSCVGLVWHRLGCEHHCQPSLQGAANVFFVLIFPLVFVYLCVVVYEATRAWRPVACMFAQLEGKPKPPELQSSSRPSPKAPSSPSNRASPLQEAQTSLS